MIWDDGEEFWYNNGKQHRLDGPAVIYSSGTQVWYTSDLLHRLDGPACIWSDGSEDYYLEGIKYTKEEYYKKIGKSNPDISISITKEDGYITIKIKV